MTTALATTNDNKQLANRDHELGVQEVIDRKRKIGHIMESVMREGEHYGKIPGCGDKPTLLKAGAEVLATTFGLAPTFKITKVDLPGGHREYEIVCTLQTIGSGTVIGEGVGSCSTMESKYRWRGGSRKCPDCGKPAIIKNKYGKGEFENGWFCFPKKGGCGNEWAAGDQAIEGQSLERTENPDIADTYNTVLKMAKKRAQVDCTLTAVGASDLLTQDLEDLPPGSRGEFPERPMYVRDEVQDAEFASIAMQHGELARKAREDELAAIAKALIADIESATSPEAVVALQPRFADLPKGTRARTDAFGAYADRLKAVTPPPVA